VPTAKGGRRGKSTAADPQFGDASTLHLSQQIFWFTASVCLFLGTMIFSFHVVRGRAATFEILGIKFTAEKAESSLIEARDQLLVIRTTLTDASSRSDIKAVGDALPELDQVLKSLGVAGVALRRQRIHVDRFGDYGYNDYGYGNGYGTDYGFVDPPQKSQSPMPQKTP
jgi:hypothetical protein